MSATDERTAEQLRSLVLTAGPAVVAPTGLAEQVLGRDRRRRRLRRRVLAGAAAAALAGGVAAAALPGDYAQHYQPSGVMEPTVRVGQLVVLRKDGVPQHGDVVVIRFTVPAGGAPGTRAGTSWEGLSRVVGLPGDTVSCPDDGNGRCDRVLVSGRPLDEPWLSTRTPSFAPVTVEPGRAFLLGDSRDASIDSRTIGTQRLAGVQGVAVARVEPDGTLARLPGTPERPLPTDADTVDPADPAPGSASSTDD